MLRARHATWREVTNFIPGGTNFIPPGTIAGRTRDGLCPKRRRTPPYVRPGFVPVAWLQTLFFSRGTNFIPRGTDFARAGAGRRCPDKLADRCGAAIHDDDDDEEDGKKTWAKR